MNAALLGLALLLPQGPDLFAVAEVDGAKVVSADRAAVSATTALRELEVALGWRVDYATRALEIDLSTVSVDLSFDDVDPRTVAHLIAAAGNADVVVDEPRPGWDAGTTVHVVPPPTPETEAGRTRLQHHAIEWYTRFLKSRFDLDPLAAQRAPEVRMHLGHLLLEQGELELAIGEFEAIAADDTAGQYIPLALLRLAQSCHRLDRDDDAERWARQVSRMHPGRPETAAATILLGRILIDAGRHDECVAAMRAATLPLADTPEIVDVLLLTARAHAARGRHDLALEQLDMLIEAHDLASLTDAQRHDHDFLRGLAAEGTGDLATATQSLEVFLGEAVDDPRRGEAFALLARTYLARDKFVEARAAVRQATTLQDTLTPEWRRETRILQAKTALALGQRDRAFEDLEHEIRRDPRHSAELVIFLVEAFIAEGRYQKAVTGTDLLLDRDDALGDRARYLRIVALWRQSETEASLESFIAKASEIAPAIHDVDLQRKVSEMIGQAHGKRGDWERAIDAYHGVLR